MIAGLTACRSHKIVWGTNTGDSTSADGGDDTDGGSTGRIPCSTITVDPLGPKSPVVGDTWVIWLSCDDVRLVGSMVISWDPIDFVSVVDNSATFLMAGDASVTVTSGHYNASLDVTVGPADTGTDTGTDTGP